MEYWSDGVLGLTNTPLLHHSNPYVFSRDGASPTSLSARISRWPIPNVLIQRC